VILRLDGIPFHFTSIDTITQYGISIGATVTHEIRSTGVTCIIDAACFTIATIGGNSRRHPG
jgi:hypothetical protein